MDPVIDVDLPLPVSWNQYYNAWRGRMVVSPKGKAYKESVFEVVFKKCLDYRLSCKLKVVITIHPRDRRKLDLDNFNKCLLDGLTDACVWDDDSLIDELVVVRGEIIRSGKVRVRIYRLD